ncbi:MAG: sulfatase [Candidatus Aminicenantes bacterium]|nr:sulfatase [Candidatus Aminicenantes bacterium]
MKISLEQKIVSSLRWGIIFGFLAGTAHGIIKLCDENYLSQHLLRLTFRNMAVSIIQGVLAGAAVFLILFLFFFFLTWVWKKCVLNYFQITVTPIKKTDSLWKAVFPSLLGLYGLIETIRFITGASSDTKLYLLKISALLIAVLLAVRLFPKDFSSFRKSISNKLTGKPIRRAPVILLVLTAAFFLVQQAEWILFPPKGPNVIFILADALRADHLGCYGYPRPTSSHIDAFADKGIVFERMMSNSPWTKPSVASLFTSLLPHEHGVQNWVADLDSKNLTLAEAFRNRKYTTAGFHANPIISSRHNFQQGFETYQELPLNECDKIADTFLGWLSEHKNKTFFAYLHFMDNHLPYDPPEEILGILEPEGTLSSMTGRNIAFTMRMMTVIGLSAEDRQHLINLYDAELIDFDRQFQKILASVERYGIADNTIIVLTADHGEELWDHGGFEHGHSVYNELLHVPMIIKGPQLPAKRISPFVQMLDVFPSLMALTGKPIPPGLRGKDFTGLLLDDKNNDRDIIAEATLYDVQKNALIKNGWKLIHNTGIFFEDTFLSLGDMTSFFSPEPEESYELYDLRTDFQEKNNLILKQPDIVRILKNRFQLILSPLYHHSVQKKEKKSEDKIREKKLKDLKSLGYIK